MSERSAQGRYRLRTTSIAVLTLAVVLGTISAVVQNATALDQISLLGFPLGFYLLAQGLLIGFVAAGFWVTSLQNRADIAFIESDEV